MEKRAKTITFEYRYFAPGEKVKAGADFGVRSEVRPGRLYTVKECRAPEESCYDSRVVVEEVEGDRPSWYFDPVSKREMAKILKFEKKVKALVDAPRSLVRACPNCKKRDCVTAHYDGDELILVCSRSTCFLMARIPRNEVSSNGRRAHGRSQGGRRGQDA